MEIMSYLSPLYSFYKHGSVMTFNSTLQVFQKMRESKWEAKKERKH